MRTLSWLVFAALCLGVGAYPLMYLLSEGRVGLLQTKDADLLASGWWRTAFYAHIVCGGVALTVGWAQFVNAWRIRFPSVHRVLGKVYVLMVCVSGVAAVCMAPKSSTGWIAAVGFGSLGAAWLFFTLRAYDSIRRKDVRAHQRLMVYSYAACCAAVSLRLWLPFLMGVLRLEFSVAYPMVAWLSWVPNLLVARLIVSRLCN